MSVSGRLRGAGRVITLSAAVVLILGLGSALVLGSEPTNSTTIAVFGDSQAQGLADGLSRVLVEDTRYHVLNRTHAGAALVHGQSEWLGPIERFTSREKADIAVVMFGSNDRLDLRGDDGYLHFRTGEWRAAYAARVDAILALLANAKIRVIWCGNPIGSNPTYSADMGYINNIYAEEAAKFGGQFVSLWTVVADDQGRYAAYGKGRDGMTMRLRADDGIHFTAAGYELIAERIVGLMSAANAPASGERSAAAGPGGVVDYRGPSAWQ